MTRVLILGGTAEARELARLLVHDDRFEVLTSLAGRVANPRLPLGRTRIGGFGGVDGLTRFLTDVDVLVDATHPFAATISGNAVAAAARAEVPLLALVRPAWEPPDADAWTRVPTVAAAASVLREREPSRVLLTTGRQDVHEFAQLDRSWFLIRVVDPPSGPLPARHELLRDRGPYTVESESRLLREHRIEVLVSKNSGSDLVAAKLSAARELGVEVVMVDRPAHPGGDRSAASAAQIHAELAARFFGRG